MAQSKTNQLKTGQSSGMNSSTETPSGAAIADELAGRSRAASIGLLTVVIANGVALLAGIVLSGHLQSIEPTAIVADLESVDSELAYKIAGLAKVVALVIAAIFFLHWFHFSYRSLSRIAPNAANYDPRWAVWSFFVPLINLFRPQQLMRELWSAYSAKWDDEPERVAELKRPTDLVNLWWGFFLTTSSFGNMVTMAAWRVTTAHDQLQLTRGILFTDAFGIAAALIAVALVRNVTALQRPILIGMSSER